MSLDEIHQLALSRSKDITFGPILDRFNLRNNVRLLNACFTEFHAHPRFRYMASLVGLLQSNHILELGTANAYLTLALARNGNKVTTCDSIRESILLDNIFEKEIKLKPGQTIPKFNAGASNIQFVLVPSGESYICIDFWKYSLIVINIGLPDTGYEKRIHDKLNREYDGVGVFGDMNSAHVKRLWETIEQEKIDTGLGFGLVRYHNEMTTLNKLRKMFWML